MRRVGKPKDLPRVKYGGRRFEASDSSKGRGSRPTRGGGRGFMQHRGVSLPRLPTERGFV
jgi:hypothetical protein